MPILYTIRSGDTLTAIARKHGIKHWREIYDHPANAAFRQKRPNPDRIFPGDVLTIPGGDPPAPEGKIRLCGRPEMPGVSPFSFPTGRGVAS